MPKNLFGQPVARSGAILGCDFCPLDKQPGIYKIKGLDRIHQRRAMLWGMCPGANENKYRLEFVGDSGELLWNGLKYVGISRDDVDTQNVVRCRSTDEAGRNRDPDKRELECCSIYNDEARRLNNNQARVHLILGEVAGRQLLGKDFQKTPIYWYEPWNAYIVYNWHPSYLVRQGGEQAGWEYLTWRDRMRAVWSSMQHAGRWGYVRSRGYKAVRTTAEFDAMERAIRAHCANGGRVSVDLEDGYVNGKHVVLLVGFGIGKQKDPKDWRSWQGQCWSVVLDHQQSGLTPQQTQLLKARLKRLLEDGDVKKTLQNGSYDSDQLWGLLRIKLRGYVFDTMYGAFLRYSFLRSCGLENLTSTFFPEFQDYKDTVSQWDGNFAEAPLNRLVLRNCGDCDVTARLEQLFAPHVSFPLMQVYIHAGATLDHMERRGPLLDWTSWNEAQRVLVGEDGKSGMIAKLDRELQQATGNPTFNARSSTQVAELVYDQLKLADDSEGRGTGKDILINIFAETGNKLLEMVMRDRALHIIESTFMRGYAESARKHNGELHTHWALTGAVTGRLRSGAGEDEESGLVNLQNLISNPLLQNLLVSDLNWREALEEEECQDLKDGSGLKKSEKR